MKNILISFFVILPLLVFLSCTSNGKAERPIRLAEVQGFGFTNAEHNLRQQLARQDAVINLIEQAVGINFNFDNNIMTFKMDNVYEGLKIIRESMQDYGPDKLLCIVEGSVRVLPKNTGKKIMQSGQASHRHFNIALDMVKKQALKNAVLRFFQKEIIKVKGQMYYRSIQNEYKDKKFYVKADFEFIFTK